MAQKSPEINASSMADIAFLLLIFFLVTTTMDVDSGIKRTLPPIGDEKQEDKGIDVIERNILMVNVNHLNRVAVNGAPVDITQLKDKVKEFITAPDGPDFPVREAPKEPIKYFPDAQVSKGIISLQNDRGTSYEIYIKVQNELTRAFSEARNDLASNRFNKKYTELADDERKAVDNMIPLKISEAEPRNLAKK